MLACSVIYSPLKDNGFGYSIKIAQHTVKLSNIRNGLRKVTFRNERGNKKCIIAILLVDIMVLTTKEIKDRIKRETESVEVILNTI